MLTALLDQDIDKRQALSIGADDYVVKRFNPVEARARALDVLRRTNNTNTVVLRTGPIEVDLEAYLVTVATGGEPCVSH